MNPDPRLNSIKDCLYRVAVKAIIIKNEKVLMVKDDEDTGWSFPGGGVDLGENLHQALKRELSEEIGITSDKIVLGEEIKAILIGHVKDGIPRCNIHFSVSLKTDDLSPTQEINSMEWLPTSTLGNEEFEISAGPKKDLIKLISRLQKNQPNLAHK